MGPSRYMAMAGTIPWARHSLPGLMWFGGSFPKAIKDNLCSG